MSHWLWKEKQHKAWAAQRLTSKARFLVINGVLAWGLPMFLVMGVGPALFGFPYRVTMTPFYWVWQPLLWAAAGLFYGLAMWHFCERLYQKHLHDFPH